MSRRDARPGSRNEAPAVSAKELAEMGFCERRVLLAHWYPTDVIQLSAQKLAIEVQTGQVVAPHAFVTIKRPDGSAVMSPHRVNLLDAAAVVSLAHRREAILSGRAEAIYAASVRACEECAYRRHCDRLRHSDPSWRRRDSFRHQQIEKGQATLNRCRR